MQEINAKEAMIAKMLSFIFFLSDFAFLASFAFKGCTKIYDWEFFRTLTHKKRPK